ncbi:protein I'm not dead yet-like [Aplysia californica]|uniref:Protein I'm not dead yet-like n=1 Tax=Aplysia californica TaxID=6500 RepID=A0ABM1VYA1_APLCA|nr:protein I'm not dead yet-like [Aplysia californica]
MGLLKQLRESWRALVVILTPVVLSPLVIPGDQASSESKCAYMLIIVSIYWITESLPLPVTALLPVALCPLLGIMSSKTACKFIFAVSGLSRVISNNLSFLQSIPTWGAAILVSAMTSLATEVTSNSVICILNAQIIKW